MDQITNFLKEHDLKTELMNDESFVNEVKKLFAENDLKFSNEQLKEIVGEIDNNLKSVQKLPQEELMNIVGGASYDSGLPSTDKSEKPPSKSAIAVEATMTILGAVVGAAAGAALGVKVHSGTSTTTLENGDTRTTTYKGKTYSPAPAVILGLSGSVIGFQFGKLIVKKYNL